MQSGELYDSGVAKHTLFEVTDIRKVMKGDLFRNARAGEHSDFSARAAQRTTAFFGIGRAVYTMLFRHGRMVRYGAFPARMSDE